jgi:hypothetical protein
MNRIIDDNNSQILRQMLAFETFSIGVPEDLRKIECDCTS